MNGGIIAHADGTPLDSRWATQWFWLRLLALICQNREPDWYSYRLAWLCHITFATEYRENRVALNANSLADMLNWMKPWSLSSQLTVLLPENI